MESPKGHKRISSSSSSQASPSSAAVALREHLMSIIQDEFVAAFNSTNLVENYPGASSSKAGEPHWFLGVNSEEFQATAMGLIDDGGGGSLEGEGAGNYSVNTSIFLTDPSGSPSTPPEEYVPYSMRPETYIIPVLFAIIFIIGVIGNGTLIVIFLKHRSMRNVPNMSIWTSVGGRYICSLAVGDILVIFFCVPFTSTVYTVESWPYGVVVCKFSEFIKDLSIGVSVFTLTALSADRYFAIVDPMRKLTGRRATRVTCITIVGIWFISILFALPSLIFSFVWTVEVENTNHTFDVCYPFPKDLDEYGYPKVVVMFKFLVYYAIPLCFIATFYIIMAHHLLLSTRNMPGEAHGQLKQIQSRKKVAKMVLSFVVIFALCFFPSHVFLIWFYYYPNAEKHYNLFWHWVRMVGFCLSFINSCINPITLYCVSGTFRKHFNRHLLCCCCKDERHSRHNHHRNHFTRGAPSGYMSHSHTDHIYADRIVTNGATQFSRASTLNKAIGNTRSRQNSQQLLPPLGTNGANRNRSPSTNGNGFGRGVGSGNSKCEGEFEMTTRKTSVKQRLLSSVEESDKFEMIKSQEHDANDKATITAAAFVGGASYAGEEDEAERALLGDGSTGAHNQHSNVTSSCM